MPLQLPLRLLWVLLPGQQAYQATKLCLVQQAMPTLLLLLLLLDLLQQLALQLLLALVLTRALKLLPSSSSLLISTCWLLCCQTNSRPQQLFSRHLQASSSSKTCRVLFNS